MSKYSKQLKDSVYESLKDENVQFVDGELETAIIDTLVPDRKGWPKEWFNPNFSPCHDIADAFSLLDTVYPGAAWMIKVCPKEGGYEAYVEDETYSVFSHTRERALVLAIWNAHNFDEMEKEEGQ